MMLRKPEGPSLRMLLPTSLVINTMSPANPAPIQIVVRDLRSYKRSRAPIDCVSNCSGSFSLIRHALSN
jgi:hypothetical protein